MEEEREHKIYKYTNKINGKVYIGRTCKTLQQRAGYHGVKYKECPYFWRAIQKYGWENFEPNIIEENLLADEASEREIFWIKEYNAADRGKGYNLTDKVHSTFTKKSRRKSINYINPMKGKKHSEEAKRKMSEHGKGRCKGRVPWNKGIPMDEETKDKLRQLNMGEKNPFYGRKHSEETIAKIKLKRKNLKKVVCLETNIYYNSIHEAQIKTGADASSIIRCCKGTQKTAGGYHWKYLEKLDNSSNS